MNVCRNYSAGLVGMEINESDKCRKTLERVKRSGSEFLPELSNVFQLLRASADFCVGRFVGRFITRLAWTKFSSTARCQKSDAPFWGQRMVHIEVMIAPLPPGSRPGENRDRTAQLRVVRPREARACLDLDGRRHADALQALAVDPDIFDCE